MKKLLALVLTVMLTLGSFALVGTAGAATTLILGHFGAPNEPVSKAAETFKAQVEALSGGAMTVAGVVSFVAGALILFNSVSAPGFARVSVPLVIGTGIILAISFFFIVSFAFRALRAPKSMGKALLIGQVGVVVQTIHPRGSIHLNGEMWSAEALDPEIPLVEGAQVEVVAVDGLRLKVRPTVLEK